MSDATTQATSAPSNATPAPKTIRIGKVEVKVITKLRTGKGERRGHPYFVPVFADGTSNPSPAELGQLLAEFGGPLTKAFSQEVIQPWFKSTSDEAVTKSPDGKFNIDEAKFISISPDQLAAMTEASKKVDELRTRQLEISSELNTIMGEILAAQKNGTKCAPETLNRAAVLSLEQAQILAQLNKPAKAAKTADKAPAKAA